MKHKKILLLTLVLILLIISSYFAFSKIYAKYLTNSTGSTSVPISKWDIKINNTSLKTSKNFSSSITPTFPGNEYIASGIIAPSAEGYFDLIFDYKDVDVSFSYDISTQVANESSVQDLVPVKYSIDGGTPIEFTSNDQHITDIVSYLDTTRTRVFRIYIKWNEDSDASMNNTDDTLASISNSPAIFNVNVKFTQITQNN